MRQIVLTPGGRLYEQIYNSIKEDITTGRLLKGEKLPSSRLLAEDLNVSRTTVHLAYDQLLSEGYIDAAERKGYFVADTGLLTASPPAADKAAGAAAYKSDRQTITKSGAKTAVTEDDSVDIDFSPHGVDMSVFPFATWKRLTGQVLLDAGPSLFTRGDPMGDVTLREEIARYLTSSRGVDCDASRIVIGAGDDYLLMLMRTLLGRRKVAMEAATYTRAARIFSNTECTLTTVRMDDKGMCADALEKSGADLAFVMPARQYPTTITMPIGRRRELLQWAYAEETRFLIEDDYDSEFRFRLRPVPALVSSDTGDKTIYIGTFSKSIAPAIRVGYLVLPKRLKEDFVLRCGAVSCTVSRIDQAILSAFLKEGYFARHLNRLRRRYRLKHDTLSEELTALSGRFEIGGEGAGLHLTLTLKEGEPRTDARKQEQKYIRAAAKAGIRVYGLHEYLRDDLSSDADLPARFRHPTLILGFAALTKEEITEGVRRLRRAWR